MGLPHFHQRNTASFMSTRRIRCVKSCQNDFSSCPLLGVHFKQQFSATICHSRHIGSLSNVKLTAYSGNTRDIGRTYTLKSTAYTSDTQDIGRTYTSKSTAYTSNTRNIGRHHPILFIMINCLYQQALEYWQSSPH